MISDRVKDHYDSYPFPGRLGAYGAWTDLAPNLLAGIGLSPEAVRGRRVLDAGCGSGEFARSFANLGASVTAVDFSSGALERAKAIDEGLGLKGIQYQQADLLHLPELGSFDLVISLGVLHHTANAQAGFRKLAPTVRPGGHMVVGLYSSVSRAHIRLLRSLLRIASRDDRDRAVELAHRNLRPVLHLFVGRENVDDRSRIADLLANPHERAVSAHVALRWFKEAGLEVVCSAPSCDLADYPLLDRFVPWPESPLALFLIQARWLLWNADYYVISGRAPGSQG